MPRAVLVHFGDEQIAEVDAMQPPLVANPLREVATKGGQVEAVIFERVEGECNEEFPGIAERELEDAGAGAGDGIVKLCVVSCRRGIRICVPGTGFEVSELVLFAVSLQGNFIVEHVPLNVTMSSKRTPLRKAARTLLKK